MAARAGVASLNYSSGRYRVWDVRVPMPMFPCLATVTATCHNSAIRSFYIRLCRRGKPRKVALIAAICKLLIILNAVVQDQIPLQPNRVPTAGED